MRRAPAPMLPEAVDHAAHPRQCCPGRWTAARTRANAVRGGGAKARSAIIAVHALLAACDAGGASSPARAERVVAAPPGTAPRGTLSNLRALASPGPAPTPALLARGAESYGVFCSPCHGRTGDGDGPVVARGFPRPPAFATQELTPARVVAVTTHGKGQMLPMAERIAPAERWAIAHYVVALPERSR